MTLYARPSEPLDAYVLAPELRQADKDEVAAHGGTSGLFALKRGYSRSKIAKTICVERTDEVVAMYGVVCIDPVLPSGGAWLLGSDQLTRHGMTFARHCVRYIETLQDQFPVLFNYVDARNTLHIRWLKWSGFNFIQRHEQFGYEQRPFYEFVRAR